MVVQSPETSPAPRPDTDIEAGVIEDARARQQRHRRTGGALAATLVAGIAAVLLSSGGAGNHGGAAGSQGEGPGPAPGTTHGNSGVGSAVGSVPEGASQMGLLSPRVGWVTTGGGLYVTRDSGHRWTELRTHALVRGGAPDLADSIPSSPALMLSDINRESVYAPCGQSATTTSANSTLPAGRTLISINAGLTWRASSVPKCLIPVSLSFVNRRDGFVFGHFDNHGFPKPDLYATTDAGRSWKLVGRPPFEGSISFANSSAGLGGGWAMGEGPVSGVVDRTTDGGRSWTRTSICGPATGLTCEAPNLFRSGRGVVLVTKAAGQPLRAEVAVETTRDFGASWSLHVLPDIAETPDLINNSGVWVPFSAPNANDLFVWLSPYLYKSANGGATWSRHRERVLVPATMGSSNAQTLSSIDFVSANYGWYDLVGRIFYTTDGGRHWTPIWQ